MGRLEDELRAALRQRAERVPMPADPMSGIAGRARIIRRRRGIAVTASSAVAMVLVASAAPALVDQLRQHQRRPVAAEADHPKPAPAGESSRTANPSRRAGPLVRNDANRIPASAPDNVLGWRTRGTSPPQAFIEGADRYLATGARGRDASAQAIRQLPLWSGPLPDGRWAYLAQEWNPTDPTKRDAWSTVLVVGRSDGAKMDRAFDLPTMFRHQRPGESVAKTTRDIDRIAGYAFVFDGYALIVGSPRAAEAAVLTSSGQVMRRPLSGGAALFPLRGRSEVTLYQLRDPAGRLLTPNDLQGQRHAARGGRSFAGWNVDMAS